MTLALEVSDNALFCSRACLQFPPPYLDQYGICLRNIMMLTKKTSCHGAVFAMRMLHCVVTVAMMTFIAEGVLGKHFWPSFVKQQFFSDE